MRSVLFQAYSLVGSVILRFPGANAPGCAVSGFQPEDLMFVFFRYDIPDESASDFRQTDYWFSLYMQLINTKFQATQNKIVPLNHLLFSLL